MVITIILIIAITQVVLVIVAQVRVRVGIRVRVGASTTLVIVVALELGVVVLMLVVLVYHCCAWSVTPLEMAGGDCMNQNNTMSCSLYGQQNRQGNSIPKHANILNTIIHTTHR